MGFQRMSCSLALQKSMPYIAMIFVQFGHPGTNVISKVALNGGMNPFALGVYKHAVATLVMAPFALFFERKKQPKVTLPFICQILITGMLGPVLGQNLYNLGLKYTSSTYATAMLTLMPVITFVMAAILRMEEVGLKDVRNQAKIVGTLTRIIKGYHAQLSITTLICLVGTIEALTTTFIFERDISIWTLKWNVNLVAVIYTGVVSSAMAYYFQGVAMRLKGPVFASAFFPSRLIIVAFMGSIILAENIHLGSVVGGVVIIVGLYAVLWGKLNDNKISRETEIQFPDTQLHDPKGNNEDLEGLQFGIENEWSSRQKPEKINSLDRIDVSNIRSLK
ncbi:WAT1-related protein At1g21890-like [Cryptomeria japonica]|uniref:WAT1-related protein At1g21890-like n=1 Tax=Cryptomeria japonica TaxID=3369 RepID=UPI0027DAA3F6|nr:WAT1-related protein At1g21890-like [Cryptomeria japonica]